MSLTEDEKFPHAARINLHGEPLSWWRLRPSQLRQRLIMASRVLRNEPIALLVGVDLSVPTFVCGPSVSLVCVDSTLRIRGSTGRTDYG